LEAARGRQVVVEVFPADLANNILDSFSWSFGILEQECGRAEFYGIETSSPISTFVVNSQTELADGAATITALNPKQKELAWIENTRISNITLLYRNDGSGKWVNARGPNGSSLEFFDDVRLPVFDCQIQ
jgi:hypothetical protein